MTVAGLRQPVASPQLGRMPLLNEIIIGALARARRRYELRVCFFALS
jgi:hypothetical protein